MDHFNEKLGLNIPEHVGIILDGNGRWAKKRFLPRNAGHVQGSKVLEQICDDADEIGIKYLTVYVFSTENWKRSATEVSGLMVILRNYLKTCIQRANNTGLTFQVALNYGGRDELTRAVKRIAQDVSEGKMNAEGITENTISAYLDTAGVPDPDLIIRTSGEQRTSNFLIWQAAYAELDFPEVLWPDFNKNRLIEAVERYNHRDRRFGGVKEE